MLSVRLLVNGLLVVKFGGSQKLYTDLQLLGVVPVPSASFEASGTVPTTPASTAVSTVTVSASTSAAALPPCLYPDGYFRPPPSALPGGSLRTVGLPPGSLCCPALAPQVSDLAWPCFPALAQLCDCGGVYAFVSLG